MRTWARMSTYWYIQPIYARITTTSVQYSVDTIGHKTSTHRDQAKDTRLSPQNSFGALAPWSYPNLIPPGLEPSKLNLDTSKYGICRRQAHLCILSLRKGLFNVYDMLLTNQQRDGSWGAFLRDFLGVPVFEKNRIGYTRFGLLPVKVNTVWMKRKKTQESYVYAMLQQQVVSPGALWRIAAASSSTAAPPTNGRIAVHRAAEAAEIYDRCIQIHILRTRIYVVQQRTV